MQFLGRVLGGAWGVTCGVGGKVCVGVVLAVVVGGCLGVGWC